MNSQEEPITTARLEELTPADCLELLATKRVGRIAWCGSNGPQVLPANYLVVDGDILLRTTPTSPIEKALYEAHAAFQVDEIDDFLECGWSVLVIGEASYVGKPEHGPGSVGQRPETWVPGVRDLSIRIHPSQITGRRLHP